jgi:hypothetical protein
MTTMKYKSEVCQTVGWHDLNSIIREAPQYDSILESFSPYAPVTNWANQRLDEGDTTKRSAAVVVAVAAGYSLLPCSTAAENAWIYCCCCCCYYCYC